jgi:hypothetical protein
MQQKQILLEKGIVEIFLIVVATIDYRCEEEILVVKSRATLVIFDRF